MKKKTTKEIKAEITKLEATKEAELARLSGTPFQFAWLIFTSKIHALEWVLGYDKEENYDIK